MWKNVWSATLNCMNLVSLNSMDLKSNVLLPNSFVGYESIHNDPRHFWCIYNNVLTHLWDMKVYTMIQDIFDVYIIMF